MNKKIAIKLESGKIFNYYIELGIVQDVSLALQENIVKFFTINIMIRFKNKYQNAGGYVLGFDSKCLEKLPVKNFIERINNVFDVEDLNDIIGKKIYVLRKKPSGIIEGFKSLDGYTFFKDHWRYDNFKLEDTKINFKKLPLRYERPKNPKFKKNRLEEIE